jgi:threonine/homoserine/homoserine lactone efflux protein
MCDGRTMAAFVAVSGAIILAPGPAQALVLATVFLAAGATSWLRTKRAHAWRSRVTGAVLAGLALQLAVQRR